MTNAKARLEQALKPATQPPDPPLFPGGGERVAKPDRSPPVAFPNATGGVFEFLQHDTCFDARESIFEQFDGALKIFGSQHFAVESSPLSCCLTSSLGGERRRSQIEESVARQAQTVRALRQKHY